MYNHNKDWKSVPIPPKMQSLPKDQRGYPVPYTVLRVPTGFPAPADTDYKFAVNAGERNMDCALHKLCTICGGGLQDDTWLIGGPLSAFHPDGIFADLPVHRECGLYALKVCPYLAIPNYINLKNLNKLQKELGPKMILDRLTEQNTRLPFMCFVKVDKYDVHPLSLLVKPKKPYLEAEYWNGGEIITTEEAIRLYKAAGEQIITWVPHNKI
jgi:hypothetical protein